LRDAGWRPQLIFLDATDEALVRRFESVRRPHPLQGEGRLLDGIQAERELLARPARRGPGRHRHLGPERPPARLASSRPILGVESGPRLRMAVMSFGFKYGVPLDADFVFDMRFLPNPFWVPELKALTGVDEPVADWVMAQDGAQEFVDAVVQLLEPVTAGLPRRGSPLRDDRVGCTGGKHRSVAMTEAIAARLWTEQVGDLRRPP
jgi:UPF0042 nucleotide-binding protein